MRHVTHRGLRSLNPIMALLLAVGLLVAAAWPVVASATPAASPSILVFVHGTCVEGRDYQAGGTVKVVQKRNGDIIATSSLPIVSSSWRTCVKTILAGDQLVVKQTLASNTTSNRTIGVPFLTVTLDAATNVESGHAPDPGSLVNFGITQMVGGLRAFSGGKGANTDVSGNFSGDWTAFVDVRAGDVAQLFWYAPSGDTFIVTSATPSVNVEVGKATVTGTGPYRSATTTLRTSAGSLRGTATGAVTGTESKLLATFRSSGASVKVKVGDRVRSSRIAGSYKVRASDVVVRKAGNGSLTATCAPGSDYAITLNGAWTVSGFAGVGGVISSTNVSRGSGPLLKGSEVRLGCRLPSGFGQVFTVIVQ